MEHHTMLQGLWFLTNSFIASFTFLVIIELLIQEDAGGIYGSVLHKHHTRKINCNYSCTRRCSKSSRKNYCHRACKSCCIKCHCVPPGTYGNKNLCPCYAKLKTHGNRPKCP